jgi:large subunit ribosomal protein L29
VVRAVELRELDYEELENRLDEYRRELLNLRFQVATGQLDNTARLGEVKKDVARVLTLLRDYEIAMAEGRTIEPLPHVERPPRPPRPSRSRRAAEAAEEEAFEDEHPEDVLAGKVDEAIEAVQEEGLLEDDEVEAEVLEAEDEAEALGALGEDDELSPETQEQAEEAQPVEEKRPRLRRRRGRAKAAEEEDAEAQADDGEEQ